MSLLKITLILTAFCLLLIPRAQAQTETASPTQSSTFPKPTKIENKDELRPHIGITAGMSSPEGSYYTAPLLGLNIGYQPYIPFGLGLSITRTDNMIKGAGDNLERTTVLAQATYNFGGSEPVLKNSWVGIAAGPVFRRDGADTGLAPILGFDIPIEKEADHDLTLGADAQYLMVNSGAPDSFNINGVVKYWF